MVSTGDTDISLRMVYSGEVKTKKYSKCQDLPNFQFSGGGRDSRKSKLKKTQNTLSVKICLIVNFQEVYTGEVKRQNTLSAKICLILNFRGLGILRKSKLKIP